MAAVGPRDLFPVRLPQAVDLESGGFDSVLEQELNRRMELQEAAEYRTPPALLQTPEQQIRELEQAAIALEGFFLTQLLKAMDRTVPKDGMFGESFASRISRELFFEKVGEELAAAGGIGLASILKEQLAPDAIAVENGDLALKL